MPESTGFRPASLTCTFAMRQSLRSRYAPTRLRPFASAQLRQRQSTVSKTVCPPGADCPKLMAALPDLSGWISFGVLEIHCRAYWYQVSPGGHRPALFPHDTGTLRITPAA